MGCAHLCHLLWVLLVLVTLENLYISQHCAGVLELHEPYFNGDTANISSCQRHVDTARTADLSRLICLISSAWHSFLARERLSSIWQVDKSLGMSSLLSFAQTLILWTCVATFRGSHSYLKCYSPRLFTQLPDFFAVAFVRRGWCCFLLLFPFGIISILHLLNFNLFCISLLFLLGLTYPSRLNLKI